MTQISGKCDKCGNDVHATNDATLVWAEFTKQPMFILMYSPRHFLPEGECSGSPSHAQYIEGQPRDNRGYEYDVSLEAKVRAAYMKVLKEKLNSTRIRTVTLS